MRETPLEGKAFTEWWPRVVEQAERCQWDAYDAKKAACDAILQQCDSKKLQRKIITENLNFDDIIKHGLKYEQSEKKVSRINKEAGLTDKDRVSQLETEVRALKASSSRNGAGNTTKVGPSSKVKCQISTRGKHEDGKCPAAEMDCFACKKRGHIKNLLECKAKGKKEKVDRIKAETNSDQDSDRDSIGRIMNRIYRMEDGQEEKQVCVTVEFTATDHGCRCTSQKLTLLVMQGYINQSYVEQTRPHLEEWIQL